jgi:signal peptidase I
MRPSIEDGDVVTVEPINGQTIHSGDIVLYQSLRDTALIHRVVKLEVRPSGRFIVTRGDASSTLDVPVPLHHVMGRVKEISREGEKIEVIPQRRGLLGLLRALLERLGLVKR